MNRKRQVLWKKLILVALFILVVIGSTKLKPFIRYKSAMDLFEKEEFEEAIEIFKELGDYKDSLEMIMEIKYNHGLKLLDGKDYYEAIKIFEDLGDYKDSNELEKQSKYLLGKAYFERHDYVKAISFFEQIKEYGDSPNFLIEAIYLEAIKQYSDGSFGEAKKLFNQVGNYKSAISYLDNIDIMEKYMGTWEVEGLANIYYIFNGWSIEQIIDSMISGRSVFKFKAVLNGEKLESTSKETYFINENGFLIVEGKSEKYRKISSSTQTPSVNPALLPPKIGMTAQEVRESSWGEPKKINKTTTVYGVSEQWVYSLDRYVYFENGVVVAIQE